MTTIAIDAMGGDNAPEAVLKAVAALSLSPESPQLVLVGQEDVIGAGLDALRHDAERIEIVHAPDVIPMDADPKLAVQKLPKNSCRVAAELVKAGDADALVSAGNTGAVTLTCAKVFDRLPGIRRAALGAVFPTERRRGEKEDPFSLILDAGLTVKATADDLVGFGIMGSHYARLISKNPAPRVALLSNGHEPKKGTPAIVNAHARLKALEGVHFIGNVEGMDIASGRADVVLTDGFTGNVVVKMLEGVAATARNLARYASSEKLLFKAGLALLSPGLRELKNITDWRQYGGAPLLGFSHLCIKAHGRSGERAIGNAIKVATRAVKANLMAGMAEALSAAERPGNVDPSAAGDTAGGTGSRDTPS